MDSWGRTHFIHHVGSLNNALMKDVIDSANERNKLIQEIQSKIKEIADQRPYKVPGNMDSYSDYAQGWSDACDILGDAILGIFPEWRELQKELNDFRRNVGNYETGTK